MIKLENVSKSYGSHTVISDLSLEITDGERVYISGVSGTGKTTLIRIIAGLEGCRGKVTVDKKIAVMFQEHRLFMHLSALENVLCVCDKKTDKAVKRAKELLGRLGLSDFENMPASELSGGMAQRVALARTLMSERSIIVLDEPFSALDKDMKEKACSLILDYCKDGKTLILVSHMQEDAEALCTRKISVDK